MCFERVFLVFFAGVPRTLLENVACRAQNGDDPR